MSADASPAPVQISWVAASYGFGDDLAYYRQVFAAFVAHFPATVIHVREHFPVQRYAELPLRADFAFRVRRREHRVSGVSYVGNLRVPTPRTLWALLRDPAELFVVVEFTPVALLGWLASRLRRRRVLMLIECDPAFRGARPRRAVTALKRAVLARCDAVLTSNAHGLRYLTDELGMDAADVLVGPYLTSDPGVHDDGAARPAQRVRLLFLNTLSSRKGIVELVDALAQLPAELAGRWTLDVVGSGEEEAVVRSRVGHHGLGASVAFHGRVPHTEVGRFYAGCDVVVCPTLGDYRSLAGIEAVNAGKPVVVSCLDGAADEIVQHAPASWLVDPRDVPAFAATLAQIVGDPGRLDDDLERSRTPPVALSLRVVGENLRRAVERAAA